MEEEAEAAAAGNTSISFTKQLLKSHLSNKIVLPLPKDFCKTHLPCHNDTIVLVENQSEREIEVGYYARTKRLVRGWRYFVRENGLLEGDTLVFKLIGPCKFKVYIKRAGTGECHQATGAGHDDPVEESLSANSKKRSSETYLVSPKEKIRPGMDKVVKLQCGNILRKLMNHSYGCIFNQPVDPVKLQIPDYFSVIRKPMDLGTIKHKLEGNRYSNMDEFAADVRLTFSNAMCYNPPEHDVHKWAKLFNDQFNEKWESLESKLKHQGCTTADNDGQESRQSARMSCQDNEKEREADVHAGADKVISGTHRSRETSHADGNSNLSVHDISNDTELLRNDKKELHDIVHQETTPRLDSDFTPLSIQIYSGSNNISEPFRNFKDIKEFEDFKIHVIGENLAAEIPSQLQMKYYELCYTQKECLHAHLTKGLNSKLVAGMIMETISTADATRTATVSTSLETLEQMEKTLNCFEDLGMTVGFLRVRLQNLVKLSRERQTVTNSMKTKHSLVEDEKTAMREKILKVDELIESVKAHGASIGSLETEIGNLEEKTGEIDKMFKEVADSPW